MYIRKSTIEDIDTIMKLYDSAREFMKQAGNPHQWADSGYPSKKLIESDIAKGISYVCIDNEEISGTFMFFKGVEPTYAVIENGSWPDDEPYGVVHRITALKGTKGVGRYCLTWAAHECGRLRIDTHEDNIPMQRLLEKMGFHYCGIVYMEDNSRRMAYCITGK